MFPRLFTYMSLFTVVCLFAASCSAGIAEPAAQIAATPGAPVDTLVPVRLVAGATPNPQGYVDVTVDELDGLLAQKNFTLVNVHIPYEGELPQTDLFIPFDQIQDQLVQLPAKDAPIVLYCRSGRMSTEAGAVLASLGYTNLYELDGGFNAWKAAGKELLQKAQ